MAHSLMSLILAILILSSFVNARYRRCVEPSKYMQAAEKLGFTGYVRDNNVKVSMEQHQEAVLKVFQLAGYFNLSLLWRDLNSIGDIEKVEYIFKELSTVVHKCKANVLESDKFDAKCMRMNLFKSDSMDIQDVLDLVLYIAQHAFNRKIGQERYELDIYNWTTIYADKYIAQARILRLINRERPLLHSYDGAWIAGASRIKLSERIIDYISYIASRNITINGETLVLAGERELWAEIDGISPEMKEKLFQVLNNSADIDSLTLKPLVDDESVIIAEGKNYMLYLAQLYNIKLNSAEPFIQYKSKEECPPGRSLNRTYANYAAVEKLKLTETLMAQDLITTYSNIITATNITIIDTLAEAHTRPDTASTARDAAEQYVKRIIAGEYGEKKDFVILFWTNNPYIERQTLSAQRQVYGVLQNSGLTNKGIRIKLEGGGFSNDAAVSVIHSEFGALMAEKWRIATAELELLTGRKPKRDINDLLFQTRQKNITIPVPPCINEKN